MVELEEDGRAFDQLDARGAQAALAVEIGDDSVLSHEGDEGVAAATDSDDGPTDDEAVDEQAAEATQAVAEEDDPIWTAAQQLEQLRMLEALLFASSEPLAEKTIAARLPEGAAIKDLLETLRGTYENRGVLLEKTGNCWRFVTAPDVAHVLEIEKREPKKLSRAALETLAIIAYHQPCTRADIEDVRGVAVSKGSLDQLLEIGWVRLRGRRKDAPGRPVLYGTTAQFLEHFGLEAVGDLPGMGDLKAAGLLDARLPPGFSIPRPVDADGEEELTDDQQEDAQDTEFAQDFMDDGEAVSALDADIDIDGSEEDQEA